MTDAGDSTLISGAMAEPAPQHVPPTDRDAWRYAGLLPAAALSLAILLVPVPPFPDVPFHLAAAEIRAGFESDLRFQAYYALNDAWGPNSLFHALAAGSGHPTWAMPILLSGSLLATAALLLALARRFRTGPVFPLIGGLFTVQCSLIYGFVEFQMGVPLILLLAWLLSADDPPSHAWPRLRWTAALAVLLLLTFAAHAMACVFALGVAGAFSLRKLRRARGVAITTAVAALPALALLTLWKLGRDEGPSGGVEWLKGYYRYAFLQDYPARIVEILTFDHFKLISPTVGPWVGGAIALTAIGGIVACAIARPRRDALPAGRSLAAVDALLAVSLVVVLFGPPGYPPFWTVFQRFVFAAIVGGALRATAGTRFAPRALVLPLALVNLIGAGLWFEHVWSFRRTSADLVALARTSSLQGVGAYVCGDVRWRNDPFAFLHSANVMTAYGHAPVMSAMVDFPFTRVGRGPLYDDRFGHNAILYANVGQLVPQFDVFGWALVHVTAGEADRDSLARVAPYVVTRGDWTIYSRAPVTGTAP